MESKNARWLKISGISGIITPIIAFTFILLAIASCPEFSWTENALSDLGIKPGITAPLFNYGLIVSGIIALVFATGLFIYLNDRALGRIGALTFILATLALFAIGSFPENVRPTHYYVSVAFFVLFPISMLVIVAASLLAGEVKMGLFTLLVAVIAAAPWILYFSMRFVPNDAIPETISALSASVWAVVLGYKMLRHASRSNAQQNQHQ
jgi:hypothetical membrane protein